MADEDKGPPYMDDGSRGNTMIETRAKNKTGLKDSGDQSLPRFTEDDLAKNIHSLGAQGEPLSQENHEFLADYHRRKARAMRPEGAYDGMDED